MVHAKSLGLSLFFCVLSLPAFAEAPQGSAAGNIPPRPPEESATILSQPPEVMIEPEAQAGEENPFANAPKPVAGCITTELLGENAGALSALYVAGPVHATLPRPRSLAINTGKMKINGVSYTLENIMAQANPAFPLSSVRYPLSINFAHRAEDGEIIFVKVPVKEGAPNLGAQQMLSLEQGMEFDPNALLPENRDMVLIARLDGDSCPSNQRRRAYMLMQPIELSPQQIEALSG